MAGEGGSNVLCNIALHVEQVRSGAVIPIRPNVAACSCIYELGSHPNLVAKRLNAAFENVFHVEVAAYLADVGRLALVDLGRIAGDDDKVLGVGEIGNYVLGNAIGKAVPLGIASDVIERQDCN